MRVDAILKVQWWTNSFGEEDISKQGNSSAGVTVEGMVVTRLLRDSIARKMPSRPSGAMPAIQADCRGDQITCAGGVVV